MSEAVLLALSSIWLDQFERFKAIWVGVVKSRIEEMNQRATKKAYDTYQKEMHWSPTGVLLPLLPNHVTNLSEPDTTRECLYCGDRFSSKEKLLQHVRLMSEEAGMKYSDSMHCGKWRCYCANCPLGFYPDGEQEGEGAGGDFVNFRALRDHVIPVRGRCRICKRMNYTMKDVQRCIVRCLNPEIGKTYRCIHVCPVCAQTFDDRYDYDEHLHDDPLSECYRGVPTKLREHFLRTKEKLDRELARISAGLLLTQKELDDSVIEAIFWHDMEWSEQNGEEAKKYTRLELDQRPSAKMVRLMMALESGGTSAGTASECAICRDAFSATVQRVVYAPCGHRSVCMNCHVLLKEFAHKDCPMCRQEIRNAFVERVAYVEL